MKSVAHCSVQGCFNFAVRADSKGNLFCDLHSTKDFMVCDECIQCDQPKCSVEGCTEVGIIVQVKTGQYYCVNHAWKEDRIASKPPQTEWSEEDKIRLRGWGIKE